MKPRHYEYLINLPLAIHIPSLHTFVVHAGLLPFDVSKSLSDPSQPLNAAATSSFADVNAGRLVEELAILLDVRQNADPYTLIEMRSVYTHGKKKGKVTKNQNKGKPWSEVWNKEMKRCTRSSVLEEGEPEPETSRKDDDDSPESSLKCSPVNVIYGHAGESKVEV